MKRFSTILLALTIAAMSSSLVLAKEKDGGAKDGDKKEQKDKAPATVGTIGKVSDTEVTIKTKKGDVTVKVDAKTVVKIDGKAAKLADLKEGMHATVPATDAGAAAKEIHVHTPKADEGKGKDKPKDKKTGA